MFLFFLLYKNESGDKGDTPLKRPGIQQKI